MKSWDGSSVLPLANDGFTLASTCPERRIAIVTIGELIYPSGKSVARFVLPLSSSSYYDCRRSTSSRYRSA
jgi:hypothetical protein